jgi:hypothetical protein
MRMKDTIRLTKAALKQPWLYTDEEIVYMKRARKLAKKGLKLKHMRGLNGESDTGASDAKS